MAPNMVQRGRARPASLPAPVGGWNARDSLPDMGATDAVYLTNWFPATTECQLRNGYTKHATGLPSQVETVMNYAAGITDKIFAISGGGVYDVTSGGPVGAAMLTGLGNSRWEYSNIATPGGNFLYMANGLDTPYLYNGTAWTSITAASSPAVTGVTTTNLKCPILHKNRIWFLESNTLKAWYLPTLSVGGAAAAVDMSSVAQLGGYLVAIATWTVDAGTGVDDLFVAVTSKGEIIVYQGTDPSSADTWELRGVWRLGSPVGARCLFKYAGDLLMISQDGVVPLSSALQSSRVNPKVALTDKIQSAVSEAVTAYGGNFGWELVYFAQQNQLWLNVPISTGALQQQYVMNTITKAWCNYEGWEANCWCVFNDQPYFGGNGFVGLAWNGLADDDAAIDGMALQAFNAFGSPGLLKRFTMARPVLRSNGAPQVLASMNVDFDNSNSTAPLTFNPVAYSVWDTSLWDQAVWGSDLSVLQSWQGISGVGRYGAIQMVTASLGIQVRWVTTDIVYETGAML
jgi:hypothetical protein